MSYLTQAQDPRRRAAALTATVAVHLVVAVALVTGLTIVGTEKTRDFLPTFAFPEPKPPEPEPAPPEPAQQAKSEITSPVPPIDLFPSDDQVIVAQDPVTDDVAVIPTPLPTFTPDPPRALFTPRGAKPSNRPSIWVTTADYPPNLIRNEIEGTAGYRLVIGTDGRVSACDVTRSSGNAQLDAATCRHIQRRARFEAATDETGAKVVGTYAGSVKWEIPD